MTASRFSGRNFALLVTGLIAAATFLGAVGSWRATEAGGSARSSERKAVVDQRTAVQQETVIRVTLLATQYDYMRKTSLTALAVELREQAATATPEDALRLNAQAMAYEVAAANQPIDPDAFGPDGVLDLEAKYDLEWFAATSRQDLDPAPEFAAAGNYRLKAERIVGVTALFVAAALFLTLAQVSRNDSGRRSFFMGGVAVATLATVLLLALEFA